MRLPRLRRYILSRILATYFLVFVFFLPCEAVRISGWGLKWRDGCVGTYSSEYLCTTLFVSFSGWMEYMGRWVNGWMDGRVGIFSPESWPLFVVKRAV